MKILLLIIVSFIAQFESFGQDTFTLRPSQSMIMTGKGPSQDATKNPYQGQNCIAVVENLGENSLFVRIQSKGEIRKTVPLDSKTSKEINLPKGYQLYFDSEKETTVRISYKKISVDNKNNPGLD